MINTALYQELNAESLTYNIMNDISLELLPESESNSTRNQF